MALDGPSTSCKTTRHREWVGVFALQGWGAVGVVFDDSVRTRADRSSKKMLQIGVCSGQSESFEHSALTVPGHVSASASSAQPRKRPRACIVQDGESARERERERRYYYRLDTMEHNK